MARSSVRVVLALILDQAWTLRTELHAGVPGCGCTSDSQTCHIHACVYVYLSVLMLVLARTRDGAPYTSTQSLLVDTRVTAGQSAGGGGSA